MKLKKENGITLIALVITIIVLLILAGVTLSLVAGENGILKRATNAVDVNERASAEEQANLVLAEIVTKYYEERYVNNNAGVGTIEAYIQTQLSEARTTEGGYIVQIKDGKVEVSKNGKPISSGEIVDGKVEWTGSSSGGNTPEGPIQTTLASVTDTNIGDYIDLGNDPLGTGDSANNWRILNTEENTVVAILVDFLPNSTGYATNAGLDTKNSCIVYLASDNSQELANALNHPTAWNGLGSGIAGATVVGGPSPNQLIECYKKRNNGNEWNEMVAATDNLLVSHNEVWEGCYSYWLPTRMDYSGGYMVSRLIYDGRLYYSEARLECNGVRPVVSLPINTAVEKEGNIWTVKK